MPLKSGITASFLPIDRCVLLECCMVMVPSLLIALLLLFHWWQENNKRRVSLQAGKGFMRTWTLLTPIIAEDETGVLENLLHGFKPKSQSWQGASDQDCNVKSGIVHMFINSLQLRELEEQIRQPIVERIHWLPRQIARNITGLTKGGFHKQPKAVSKELTRSSRFHPGKDPISSKGRKIQESDRNSESKP